jgi:hypothetical protein
MTTQAQVRRQEITVHLDTVSQTEVSFEIGAFAVKSFDGTAGSVVLSTRKDDKDARSIILATGGAETIAPSGCSSWWIINRTAQPGKTLVLIVGTTGHTITPGYTATAGAANSANQATEIASLDLIRKSLANFPLVTTGTVTVGAASGQLTSVTVPEGCAITLKSRDTNTGTITLSAANPAVLGVGFNLSPGSALSLRVDNPNVLWAISDVAAQVLEYIAEKE